MTENPTDANPEDAASLLDAVKETQSRTQQWTRPGYVDFVVLLLAGQAGKLIDPDTYDSWGRIALMVVLIAMLTQDYWLRSRHQRNLGASVRLPTWIAAGAMAAISVIAHLTAQGDVRRIVLGTVLFGIFVVLGALYRSALLAMTGGLVLLVALGRMFDVEPVILVPVVAVAAALTVYVGRKQIFTTS